MSPLSFGATGGFLLTGTGLGAGGGTFSLGAWEGTLGLGAGGGTLGLGAGEGTLGLGAGEGTLGLGAGEGTLGLGAGEGTLGLGAGGGALGLDATAGLGLSFGATGGVSASWNVAIELERGLVGGGNRLGGASGSVSSESLITLARFRNVFCSSDSSSSSCFFTPGVDTMLFSVWRVVFLS